MPTRQRMVPAPPLPPVLPPLAAVPLAVTDPAPAPAPASTEAPDADRWAVAVEGHGAGTGTGSGSPRAGGEQPVPFRVTTVALGALADAHEAHLLAMARMHEQFVAQQRAAAAAIITPGRTRDQVRRPRIAGTQQAPPPAAPDLPGPKFGRAELEELATMRRSVSSLFGPGYAAQDGHRYQIRIPAPPMLFTDRILGFEGTPRSLGRGRVWAEIDLTENMFGLDPAGRTSIFLLGEAGQASMLLASWLGADLCHDGDSRYRVLDLDMTIRGSLPRAGQTLRTEITLERHATAGGMRLFFFQADASVAGRLVGRGRFCTGLFTEAELAQPAAVAWSPPRDAGIAGRPLEVPREFAQARSFGREELAALRAGRVWDCFGQRYQRTSAHGDTPLVATPELSLLDSVEALEPAGGPAGRGYLRATHVIEPSDWYFAAHLPGDPCMPGFLVLDGAFQALAFYLTAMGATIARDGWRFEPPSGQRSDCRFRGQILPRPALLEYEVFVESMTVGPAPLIAADVIARLDGRVIFHGRRLALQLIRDEATRTARGEATMEG